jgi:hypothetical protein
MYRVVLFSGFRNVYFFDLGGWDGGAEGRIAPIFPQAASH